MLYFGQWYWSKIEQFAQVSGLYEINNLYEKARKFRVFAKIAPKTLEKRKSGTYIAQGKFEIQGIELSAKKSARGGAGTYSRSGKRAGGWIPIESTP